MAVTDAPHANGSAPAAGARRLLRAAPLRDGGPSTGIDLDDLRAFLAVAESGSVTTAATRLHLSQPAVTRRLQRLEADLGVELFDRHSKPMTPTAAGRAALDKGRRILQSVDDLLVLLNGRPSGAFRLGVSMSFAALALARPIDEVRKTFPRVAFEVVTGWSPWLIQQVRQGALDLAFVASLDGQRAAGEDDRIVLGHHPLVFVAPRRLRLPAVVEPRLLADVAWVLNPPGCAFRSALQQLFHVAGVPLRIAVGVYGWDLQLSLVARGVGVGLFPAWIVARSRLRPQLRTFRIRGVEFRAEFGSVHGHLLALLEPVASALDRALAGQIRTLR